MFSNLLGLINIDVYVRMSRFCMFSSYKHHVATEASTTIIKCDST